MINLAKNSLTNSLNHRKITAVVLVTHGHAGKDMIEAAQAFLHMTIPQVTSVGVTPEDTSLMINQKIDHALEELHIHNQEDVLFLVDLVGSTPARLCSCKCRHQGHVVTGVNLPMLVKLATANRYRGPIALGDELVATGTKSIHHE